MASLFLRGIGLTLITSLGVCLCVAQVKPAAKKRHIDDDQLQQFAAERDKHVCVTEKPHLVKNAFSGLCRELTQKERDHKGEGPHENYLVKVFITANGQKIMTSGRGVFPVGTAILKEKSHPLPAAAANAENPPAPPAAPEFFTGMVKREAGYNPACGDWEFFIVSGDAKTLLARGKLDSCVACHQDYKRTDYVTRAYMPADK